MAKVIQVRDVPEEIHRELTVRAAEAGLSLSACVLQELRAVAARSAKAEILMRAAQRSGGPSRQTILDVIDEGRAERDRR